jgi:hypothetical protein
MTTAPPAFRQLGTVGDITAACKVRVFDVPFEDAYAIHSAGKRRPSISPPAADHLWPTIGILESVEPD